MSKRDQDDASRPSQDGSQDSTGPNTSDKSKDDLLDDLETIRSLLDKEQAPAADSSEDDDESGQTSVPQLDDVVGGVMGIDESPLTERTATLDTQGGLDDDLFQALLGDAWKTSAAQMLKETRADIEANRHTWAPEDTDSLNAALRVRIDDTLRVWLQDLVRQNMLDLRNTLLSAIDDQLKQEIEKALAQKANHSDNGTNETHGK
jgi:hypothetical protein